MDTTPHLPVGTLVDQAEDASAGDPRAPAVLDPTRFNRHTFWCGQSGSGKTYALGVVLEQLLVQTRLPILVLDPNADFVRLAEVREDADPQVAAALAGQEIRVLRSGPHPDAAQGVDWPERLHVRFAAMDIRMKAAVLRLDPMRDAEEYNELLHLADAFATRTPGREGFYAALHDSDSHARHQLLLRLQNLGVLEWDLWAWGAASAEDVVDARPRATVLDLSGFATQHEPKVAALAVLDHLWASRDRREPLLVVIDEAHNLCSAEPFDPVEVALTERIVQIAAEGRKYGLWLLLSTQRPSKIHPNALSQCDNLGLMKMSSPRDLAELADWFGFAPAELLQRSPGFRQGQVLFAGGFVGQAAVVQMARRQTPEGGSDVRVPL
ncbi:ATP-binding protein [Cellulomonas soli]|uniref:Helicase HerA central domain-containing protein n=1 Tax=Cellulomonas soli TaxID=931535 RepID=A0A512PC78_9CELL|nr:ATP-binding protein [Cellulomonas soli]NYI58392.1 hypothetical protein [Cellulomonas soli]GEP68813.1 hypothetical protein CSO01_15280 [Cellulomonas soli]